MDDTDGLYPPLNPDVKAGMSLDEIIAYEKGREACRNGIKPRKRYPFKKRRWTNRFWRRYPSQNWRLGGNGPGPYRRKFKNKWKAQVNSARMGKVRAFLQRKWQSTPSNSVFHRLGWNATQSVALSKLYSAKYFRKPPQFWSRFKKNGFRVQPYCPDRLQRMKASAEFYSRNDGLSNVQDTQTAELTNVNLQRLSEALGETVCDIKRSKTDDGSVVTIRTSDSIPKSFTGFHNQPMSSFEATNDSFNASNYSALNFRSPLIRSTVSSLNSVSNYNLAPNYRSPLLHSSGSGFNSASNFNSMNAMSNVPFIQPNYISLAKKDDLTVRIQNEIQNTDSQNANHQNNANYLNMPPLVSSREQYYVQTTNVPCSARFSAINPYSQGVQSMEQ